MNRTGTRTWTRAGTRTTAKTRARNRTRFMSIRTNSEKATGDEMWSPQPSRDQSPGARGLVLETMKT